MPEGRRGVPGRVVRFRFVPPLIPEYSNIIYHPDCRHFRGDIPCLPNKREGVRCDGCPYYEPLEENVLIIKLGAAGDVIRTTPILPSIRRDHPKARIW